MGNVAVTTAPAEVDVPVPKRIAPRTVLEPAPGTNTGAGGDVPAPAPAARMVPGPGVGVGWTVRAQVYLPLPSGPLIVHFRPPFGLAWAVAMAARLASSSG